MKRTLMILMSLLLLSPIHATGAEISDEMEISAGRFNSTNSSGHIGYLAYPRSSGLDVRSSFLLGMKVDSQERPTAVSLCDSLTDCAQMEYFSVAAILPNCTQTVTSNCLESFFARDKEGKRLDVISQGLFTREIHNNFRGDRELGIPDGVSPTLYRIPGAPHEAGDLYLPLITRSGPWDRGSGPMREFDNTSISLFAVQLVDGAFVLLEPSIEPTDYQSKRQINTTGPDGRCIFNDSDTCAVASAIPRDVTFGFTVKYSSLKQNWFHGRVTAPEVKISTDDKKAVAVTVTGRAIQSSGFFTMKERKNLPRSVVEDFDQIVGGKGVCTGSSSESSCYNSNLWQTPPEMERFLTWLDVAGDRASFDPTVWTINAMNQSLEHPRAQQCTPSGEVVGMVSTNASQYIAGPPVYNPETLELEYKVAAPHLRSDGSVFRGTYDLAVNAQYARCLYGISGTSIRASVSVTSSGGELISASASQTVKNGWLYLSANNFTFSAPTVRVRLTSEASSKKRNPTPSKMICSKGSKTKVISGKNSKCPKGYRKS